ncbi:VaFE repeat-containing surface-anchored protein [Enterococcus sp.]|uniref:VaFE repeat-containing surface-anchored protein n=1 Tax=Enterococcus sp. TaxID=35783 RepID=UPI00290D70D1|nr:VaFE repeat-containing surface-anchored protein [Enterococcus sp.]MDU5335079.1 VaFE repeat-containing surface-anchored protein [Enterococcus sp.]
MKTRIRKILGKMTRITAILFMVVSSLGINGLSLIAEAGSTASEGTGFGVNAYGYMYGGSTHKNRFRTVSYATGGSEPNGAKFMFCTENGKMVNDVGFGPATQETITDPIGAYLMNELVNKDYGGIGNRHLNHATVSYYVHKYLETGGAGSATAQKFNESVSAFRGDAQLENVIKSFEKHYADAQKYAGPYTATVKMTQVPGTKTATAKLVIKSANGTDVSQWYGSDIKLTMTGGQFKKNGESTSVGNITINKATELDNYTLVQGPAGNPLSVTATINNLPGTKLIRYNWTNSQNMVGAYVPLQAALKVSDDLEIKQEKFSINGTTKTPTELEVGDRLTDELTISLKEGKWAVDSNTGQNVPVNLEVDWYYSTQDFGNTKYNVNNLPGGVTKVTTDTMTITGPGTYQLNSKNLIDKQGYYYPVLKMDLDKQGTSKEFLKEGFQASFNDTNEKIKVVEKFSLTGTTKAKSRVNVGDTLTDTLTIQLEDSEMKWPDILGTNDKVPVKLVVDWYYSETDYGNTQIDVGSLPGDISYLGKDELTITKTGEHVVNSHLKSTKAGFYYPVLKLDLNDQANKEHFYNGFQCKFNEQDEQTLTKWKPKVKTETTVAQLSPEGGKVADKLTVTDNKGGHEITITSKLLGPFLTKPDFIKNGNNHEGGSPQIPANAKVAGSVTTKIQGNGTVTTPEIQVTEKGWYVWVEEIAETTYTEPWYSDFGSADEYVVVPWTPNIETTVSESTSEIESQVYDSITVLDLPGLWGLPTDGKGDTDKWGLKNPELVGKDRDPDKDGNYNLPDGFGKGEDKAIEATFTMYYSPTKPLRGSVPANAEVFDTVKAPLLQGTLRTTEFKPFDKAGWYTIVVSGGSDEGRLAKFETEYGVPSETVHVPQGSEEEYYTQVNEEHTFIGKPVYDTLHVNKALKSDDAEVTFTLYKYSDKVNDFDYSNPKEIAKSSKGMPIKKYGEYKSNAKGYGLEDLRISEPGTYGWVAKVVDTKTDKVLYEGKHGDVGEVFNVEKLNIHTKASSNDIYLGEPIYDTIILENTVPDGYYVIVDLYKFSDKVNDFANAESATDKDIVWTSEKIKVSASGEYKTGTFTPKEIGSYGYVEKLYDDKGNLVHTGKKGEKTENVIVRPKIEIGTSAKDKDTGINEGNAVDGNSQPKEEITIIDTVSYKDLVVGREYTVKGVLMDKSTGQAFVGSDGKKVTAERTFEAETENGTIDLEFIVKKTDMRGKTVVVFEKLYEGEKEVAVHEEIDDEDQTVNYPELETNAKDGETGTNEGNATDEVTIVDKVTYKNLIIGREYTVNGTLMDKETGLPFLTKEGNEVHAEKKFTAEKANGSIELTFTITKGDLAGKTIVVFEKLYNKDKEVGSHTDIEDDDQTVYYPNVGTKAAESSIHGDKVVIEDIVSYENLIPGKQYKVEGVLMDKETGKAFLVDKKEVTGSATFNASGTGNGTVKVTFTFDRKALKDNKELVVFERVYGSTGKLVGTHEDIDDEDQTVEVKPEVEIKTTAKDEETEMNEGLAKEEVKIIDTVSYKNLNIGQEYTVKGVLMDKATGKPFLTKDGKEVHAERDFVAEKQNGTIELTFTVTKGDLAGKTVVVFETLYVEDKEVGSHTDINDKEQSVNYPEVGTKASETSIHGDTVILKDIVSYDNLIPGKEYKVTGTLMDKATGEAFKVDDKEITGEATFTANKKGSGTVEVEFTFARKALEDPKNLVVFEKLYNVEGKLVGLHEDIEDKDQTVEVKPEVEVKTDAIDKDTEMNEGLANERVTIVDRVSYKHLIVGKNYTVKGTLMDKATGKPFLTREGDEVHAEKTFKAEQSDGTINLEFYIKRGDLAGKTVVVFEKLYHDEKEVAVHTDIEDEAQTVTYPKVGTKASETTGSTDKEVIIKDIVSYENLVPGKEYTVTGTLMDKATGKPFKAGDDEVTGKATFVAAESGSGTVEVTFQFDRSHLTEETVLVVFEKLFNAEGKLVGLHEDIEDEDQTVRQPQVSTKAKDKETGTNEGFADEDVTVVDEVSYKNLEIGKEYTVKGVLMDKATNKPFVTRDGNEVHAEKTFTATKRDGTIELEFKITKGDLAGKTVVVFETLYQEEKEVAAHTDIEDKEQSVHYPKVRTQAAEVSSDSDEDVVIKDIVFYENLIPGESYTVRGKLMMKDANAPFTVMGREVESQATFVASDSGSGTVEMTFTFRRSLLSNDLTLVVFEKLFDAKGNLIGAHEDINDEAQTVTIKKTNPELPKTKGDTFNNAGIGTSYGGGNYDSSYSSGGGGSLPQTGERVLKILPYLGLVIVILAGALYFYRKRQV